MCDASQIEPWNNFGLSGISSHFRRWRAPSHRALRATASIVELLASAASTKPDIDHPSPRPPPSSYSSRSRKRSRRKSKASLRPSMPISMRSRSSTWGGSAVCNACSKSRSKKGKEPAQAESPVPWIPSDVEGSFLEMEGRPAGDETGGGQVGGDGEGHDDVNGSVGEEPLADSSETGASEPLPNSLLSNPTSIPESQAPPMPTTNVSQPPVSPSPLGDDISLAAVTPSTSASTPEHISRCSSSSLPSSSPGSSAASTLLIPLESELHHRPQSSPSHSTGDVHVVEKIARGKVGLIPDPASIFPASASSKSMATTTVSVPDLSRRGYSLELTFANTSINSSGTKSPLNGGSKIRRSISEFLHFSASSRIRRQSVPLPFKSCSGTTSSGAVAGIMRQNLPEVSWGEGALENRWEDVREDHFFATLISPVTPPALPHLDHHPYFSHPSNPCPPVGSTDSDFDAYRTGAAQYDGSSGKCRAMPKHKVKTSIPCPRGFACTTMASPSAPMPTFPLTPTSAIPLEEEQQRDVFAGDHQRLTADPTICTPSSNGRLFGFLPYRTGIAPMFRHDTIIIGPHPHPQTPSQATAVQQHQQQLAQQQQSARDATDNWDTDLNAAAVEEAALGAECFDCTDEENDEAIVTLWQCAWAALRAKVDEQTADTEILTKLRTYFEEHFCYDEHGVPRIWKPVDDIDGTFKKTRLCYTIC
ncbi:root hair defective 3 GTP-binding protein-domain-containing protein [Russula emetica]|nr:root hair defective 3 GTP-binding protein-domain-containing protein [Russula emetica]